MPSGEYILRDRHRGRRVRPAGVEREMRDHLRQFAWSDAVVERERELLAHLGRLIPRDQGGDRHQAAIARRQAGTFPEILLHGVLPEPVERGRDTP